MNHLIAPVDCPNCQIPIPPYQAGGDGYRNCDKCGYMMGVAPRELLLFLMTFKSTAEWNKQWQIQKVYQDSDWQQEYRDLPSPKIAVFWDLCHGMQVNRITFKEKLTLEDVPWKVIESKFNPFDIQSQVRLWLFEYNAGLRQPDDGPADNDNEDDNEDDGD